jgi:hypothetical protein
MAIISLATVCHIAIFPFQTLYTAVIRVFTLREVVRARMAIISLPTVMSHCLSISNPFHGCNYSIYLEGGGES